MSQFNLSSKSLKSKPKRGLSLSLQKKNHHKNNQSQKDILQRKQYIFGSGIKSPHSSNQKNRIKLVQSYQKNQSDSKTNKCKFFKNTDEDIKLGGSKKSTGISKNLFNMPQKGFFNNNNLTFQPNLSSNVHQLSQRKLLRESKVMNLASNINYFQNVYSKIESQKSVQFVPLKKQDSFNYFQSKYQQKLDKPEQKIEITPQQRYELQQKLNEIQQQPKITTSQPQPVLETNEKEKKNPFKDLQIENEKNQLQMLQLKQSKQSINRRAIEKLKKVQTNIDRLLTKVTQTRAYLLR